jgi:hypothetical protein
LSPVKYELGFYIAEDDILRCLTCFQGSRYICVARNLKLIVIQECHCADVLWNVSPYIMVLKRTSCLCLKGITHVPRNAGSRSLQYVGVYQASQSHISKGSNLYMNMKNGVFWVVTPCGSCKNRRF